MQNAVYACNLENEIVKIRGDADAISIHQRLASHTGYQPVEVQQTMFLAVTENIDRMESTAFAYPNRISIKKGKPVNEWYCLSPNDQIRYTICNPDVSMVKLERNSIFVREIVQPKKKRLRRKKGVQRNNHKMAKALKWEDLRYQPEIEAKYDCNVKPNDYAQYLNDPVCDPMFCQFDTGDTANDKHTCIEAAIHEFEPMVNDHSDIDDKSGIEARESETIIKVTRA